MNSDNDAKELIPTTAASSGPAMQAGTEAQTKTRRLKATAGMAASALLATSLLLSACTEDDCIPQTAPSNTSNNSFVLPAPPASSQFTTGSGTSNTQTYCRSRRTGGYFWYVGSTGSYNTGGTSASS